MGLERNYCSYKPSCAQAMLLIVVAALTLFLPSAAYAEVKDCSDYQLIRGGYSSPTCTVDQLRAYLATLGIETADPRSFPPPSPVPSPKPPQPAVIPYFGKGIASGSELARVAGHVRVSFEKCPTNYNFGDHRRVLVHLGKQLEQSLFQTPAVADALLAKGARAAWKACPQAFSDARTDFHYNIESVQILDGGGKVVLSATLGTPGVGLNSDQLFASDRDGYAWTDVSDHYSARQWQPSQAGAPLNPDGSIPVGRRTAQPPPYDVATPLFGFLWRWIKIIGGASIAIWLFNRREAIAEWYYSLQPHPASRQVENALVGGLPIDGDLFATVNQPFDGNKYEISARNKQADTLTKRLRRHEEVLRSNSEAILRRKREELLREQEFMKAHEALINAGVDHEIATAHLKALRKATEQ